MSTYKFSYFNVRARGETARMLFKLADQPFDDIRISSEEWTSLKPELPTGQLPVLDVDGVQIIQSNAINRFLAKKFGYAGKTEMECAQVDAAVYTIEDLTPRVLPLYDLQNKDEEREKYAARFVEEFFIPGLKSVQKVLEMNNGGDGFFVGDSVTFADLLFVNILDYLVYMSQAKDVLDQYPKLKALKARVESLPKIQAWILERPDTKL